MAFTKNYMNEIYGPVLVLSALLSTASAVDCHGKSFRCVNSTHFMICVDLGGGVSQAIDNFFIACPPPTICQGTNHFECEFPAVTTPPTTLINVDISEITLPWEDVVTASSPRNTSKEYSENYINTDRITTAAESMATTDATEDFTGATANITEIVPIITKETTINERVSIAEIVPTLPAESVTLTPVESVTQIMTESKDFSDTYPEIIEKTTDITTSTVTENIIQTNTLAADSGHTAPITTEQLTETTTDTLSKLETVHLFTVTEIVPILTRETTIKERVSIAEFVPTLPAESVTLTPVESVTQIITGSIDFSDTYPEIIEKTTDITTSTVTENIIETNSLAADSGHIAPITTEQVTETTTDFLSEIETVQLFTELPHVIATFSQNENIKNNTLLKEPSVENITEVKDKPPVKKSTNVTNDVENGVGKGRIILTTLDGSNKSDQKQPINKEENKIPQMPIIDDITQYTSTVTENLIKEITTTELVLRFGKQNPTTYDYSEVTVTTDVPTVYAYNVTEDGHLHENFNTKFNNVTASTTVDAQNSTQPTILDGKFEHGPSNEQLTTTNEENLTTDTTLNIAIEIITKPTNESVDLGSSAKNAEYIPPKINNSQPKPPAVEDNLITESPLFAIENVIFTINNERENGISTNRPTTINEESLIPDSTLNTYTETNVVHSHFAVNQDITTTEAMAMPTTNSNAQSTSSPFENNLMTEASDGKITDDTIFAGNNEVNTDHLMTTQLVNVDIMTTESVYIPTTINNPQSLALGFEDHTRPETPLPTAKNNVATINNEASTKGFIEVQSTDLDIITEESRYVPTTIKNAQILASIFGDHTTTEAPLPTANDYVVTINNETGSEGLMTVQPIDVEIITIDNDQPLTSVFEDTTEAPLPNNIVVPLNNSDSTKRSMTAQSRDLHILTTEAVYVPTTVGNAEPIELTYEENAMTVGKLFTNKNAGPPIVSSTGTNIFLTDSPILDTKLMSDAGLDTEFMTDTTVVSPINAIELDKEKSIRPLYGEINTAEIAISVPVITEEKSTTTIMTNQLTRQNSKRTGINFDGIESNGSLIYEPYLSGDYKYYNDTIVAATDITTEAKIESNTNLTNYSFSDLRRTSHRNENLPYVQNNSIASSGLIGDIEETNVITININNKMPSFKTTPNDVELTSHILTENPLLISTIKNTILVTGKQAPKSVNEQAMSHNADTLDTASSTSIFDNGTEAATRTSTYSNSKQGESKTIQVITAPYSELRPSNTKSNGRIDKIIQNIVATSLDISVYDAKTSKTPSVTNINVPGNDRKTSSVGADIVLQQTTKSSVVVGNLNDTMTTQTSMGLSNISAISSTNGLLGNISKVNNVPETDLSPHKAMVENISPKNNQNVSLSSWLKIRDIKPIVKPSSSAINDGKDDFPTLHKNLPSLLVTNSPETYNVYRNEGLSDATRVETVTKGAKVYEEVNRIDKPAAMLAQTGINTLILTDLTTSNQVVNDIVTTESYRSSVNHIFTDTQIQTNAKVGDMTSIPRNSESSFDIQKEVHAVEDSNSNTETRVESGNKAPDAILNPKKGLIESTDISSLSSEQGKNILNKITSTSNDAHILQHAKPNTSEINIVAPRHNLNQTSVNSNSSDFTVSAVYRKNNTTVDVPDLQSQNISIIPERELLSSTKSENVQSEQSLNSSTNITLLKPTQAKTLHASTARTLSKTVTTNPILDANINLSKYVPNDAAQTYMCINGIRGRYSDKIDCRKFYICVGNNQPIIGNCPENTVFSDFKKLCTKNMSHCIRDNEFKCPSEGRFSDLIKGNIYYICVNHKNHLYRFKFQCQKGYILNKTTVHCVETKERDSNESSSSADTISKTNSLSIISSSTSKSRTSNSSSRTNDSSNNSENSSKTKQSNEPENTLEKSEGDEEDDVFRCKKEGKFPIKNECRRYYLCKKNGKSEYRRKIKKCDSDEVFHKDKKRCVDADSYEC